MLKIVSICYSKMFWGILIFWYGWLYMKRIDGCSNRKMFCQWPTNSVLKRELPRDISSITILIAITVHTVILLYPIHINDLIFRATFTYFSDFFKLGVKMKIFSFLKGQCHIILTPACFIIPSTGVKFRKIMYMYTEYSTIHKCCGGVTRSIL